MLTLFFHSNSDKNAFMKWNRIAPEEILEETPASLSLRTEGNEHFTQSVYVYQSKFSA